MGTHVFFVTADDSARLFANGELVATSSSLATARSLAVVVPPGASVPLVLEFKQGWAHMFLNVTVSVDGGANRTLHAGMFASNGLQASIFTEFGVYLESVSMDGLLLSSRTPQFVMAMATVSLPYTSYAVPAIVNEALSQYRCGT